VLAGHDGSRGRSHGIQAGLPASAPFENLAFCGRHRRLRPRVDRRVVDPEELEKEAERLGPHLVLCSQPEPRKRERLRSWVEFHPYADEPRVRIRTEDRWSVLEDAGLDDLLAIVDAAIPSP
jgi:hypothetical protein